MMHYLSIELFALMPMLFFVCGLSFSVLGAIVAFEKLSLYRSAPFVRLKEFVRSPWGALAVFGLLYGIYEFMGAFNTLYSGGLVVLKVLRFIVLPLSFYFLCRFGVIYGRRPADAGRRVVLPDVLAVAWVVLCLSLLVAGGFGGGWSAEARTGAKYLMGFPAGLVAALGLAAAAKETKARAKKYLIFASFGFVLFAASLVISPKADFFPLTVLNYESFYRTVHIPIEVFRMAFSVLITFALLMFFRLSRDFVSIRFKAILHVILAVAMPAFCIILLVAYLMSHSLLRLSYKDNEIITAQTAGEIGASLARTEKSIKYGLLFANNGRVVSARGAVGTLFADNAEVTAVAFLDGDGEILRAVRDPSTGAIIYKGTAQGRRIGRLLSTLTLQAALADFYVAGRDERSVFLELPVPGGRIRVGLDLKRLFDTTTRDLRMEKGWHVVLLDDKGRLVLHGDGGGLLKQAVFEPPGFNRGDYGKTTVEDGVLRNAIEERIRPIGWSFITEIPREDIVAPVFQVFKGLMTGLLAICFFAVILGGFIVDKVIRPINTIAERVKSIGQGDLASAVNIKTGDEIQTLSEEVEKMALMLAEKKEMEKRLLQTQKIASLGRLVAGVAHEINNPLSVILWSSELLLREFKPEDRRYGDLKLLEKHALGCKKIVDDLLRFSRTGKQRDVAVDINRNIEETLSLIGKLTKGHNVNVTLDFDPSLPPVKGDPDRLRQVFLNMAVNAVDAMKKSGGELTVRTRPYGQDPERSVEVTFTDTGCGMSPADMERIFDPFFTTKKDGEGTGLGLSVSYGIVEAHNGRMWVESEEGKGSTFHILLPELRDNGNEE